MKPGERCQAVVGVVGAGKAYERLYRPALAHVRGLVVGAIADPEIPEGQGVRCWPSLAAMLSETMLEGLLILSPAHLHGEQVGEGLAAGLHVLTEKPPACTTAEVDAWPLEGAGTFAAAYTRRGWRGYREARRLPGERWELVLETDPRGWGARSPGPIAWDLLPHAIDLAEWVTGTEIVGVAVDEYEPVALAGRFDLADGRRFFWKVGFGPGYREVLWVDGRQVLERPARRRLPWPGRLSEPVEGVRRVLAAWSAMMASGDDSDLLADRAAARRHVAVLEEVTARMQR